MSKTVAETLVEREEQHGPFKTHATIENHLQVTIRLYGGALSDVQRIGLSMVLHKAARILNNGHNHIDSWHDIQGYARLVELDMLDEQVDS